MMADGGTGRVELPLECATVSLAELRRMLGVDARATRRKLRKHGIKADGRRVHLSDLRTGWPMVFNSLLILKEPAFRCPRCESPTIRTCTSCDFCRA